MKKPYANVLVFLLLSYFCNSSLAHDNQQKEIICDESLAKTTLIEATQDLEASLKNEYPHLKFNCQANKGYAPVNFSIVDTKIENKKGAHFEFFKGSAVCSILDTRLNQKTLTGYNFSIDKVKCKVLSSTKGQSKTNFSYN